MTSHGHIDGTHPGGKYDALNVDKIMYNNIIRRLKSKCVQIH